MRMKTGLSYILFVTIAMLPGLVHAQEQQTAASLSWVVSPFYSLPLGERSGAYSMGGGGRLAVEYAPPGLQNLSLGLSCLYDYEALQDAAGSTSELAAVASAAWRIPIVDGLSARTFAGAGYSFGFMNGSPLTSGGAGPLVQGGAGLAYAFTPSFSLRFDVSYLWYIGLYGGLGTSFSLCITPPAPRANAGTLPTKPSNLIIGDITLGSVFPVFHAWYDQHPVGTVVVKNTGKDPITNIGISLLIKEYMDSPKECASIATLGAGESREMPLYALFNTSVLDVTEATKAACQVTASGTQAGEQLNQSRTATIRIENRNAMTWDDDRKAAAFVSGKDPWVMDLSNNVTAMVKGLLSPYLNKNLQLAMAFHDALRLYGLSYSPSPVTPYSETSRNPVIVDFLKGTSKNRCLNLKSPFPKSPVDITFRLSRFRCSPILPESPLWAISGPIDAPRADYAR